MWRIADRACLVAGTAVGSPDATPRHGRHPVSSVVTPSNARWRPATRWTLVHRRASPLFPESEHLLLDRTAGPEALAPLVGREFDGLIDVSAYVPRAVRQLADVLGDRVGRALYVSSVSAYASGGGLQDPTGLREVGASEVVTEESYGPLKVACEQEFSAAYPSGSIVRPTYVVGPQDHTDRFTYWVRRAGEGGAVLLVEPADADLQVIDARDLADFMVGLVERGASGPSTASAPRPR